ncbi:thiol-disulfide oxidoreductase DCC family protein [Mesorhizobium sp. A623]
MSAHGPERGLEIAARHGRSKTDLQGSYLVITPSETLDRSDATVALLRHMRAPWRWLTVLRVLPKPLRGGVYDIIARKRYAWFGTTDQRLEPSAVTRDRFTFD